MTEVGQQFEDIYKKHNDPEHRAMQRILERREGRVNEARAGYGLWHNYDTHIQTIIYSEKGLWDTSVFMVSLQKKGKRAIYTNRTMRDM